MSTVAHELKHAYQYEVGEVSFSADGSGGVAYDITDEFAAFERGRLFGGASLSQDEIRSTYPGRSSQRLSMSSVLNSGRTLRDRESARNFMSYLQGAPPRQYYKGYEKDMMPNNYLPRYAE